VAFECGDGWLPAFFLYISYFQRWYGMRFEEPLLYVCLCCFFFLPRVGNVPAWLAFKTSVLEQYRAA
jgi:hypothetical protein